ncbi:MAG: ABC transporter ATP-binding protein [Oligoflexales bacterium]|nr:ABC transporter ATP-binding protein [Oligoflexales bacterium]
MELRVHKLSVFTRAGAACLLKQVSLTLPKGKLTVVIGPNGAGKSTLLRSLAGLDGSATKRCVLLGSQFLEEYPALERARSLTWCGESSPAFSFSVQDTILMGLYPWAEIQAAEKEARLERLLSSFSLASKRHRSILSLSSGELQKVLLARALIGKADILLFDEPEAHLDYGGAVSFLRLLKQELKSGRTICASMHDLALAKNFADYLFVLSGGKILTEGSPEQVLTGSLMKDLYDLGGADLHKTENQVDFF